MEDITLKSLVTIGGVAAVAGILTQILKKNLSDWRYTNFVVIGIGVVLAIAAQCAIEISYGSILIAGINGLLGAALATLAYETKENALGILGKGNRSDHKLIERAENIVGIKKI